MHQTIERPITESDRKRLLDCLPLAPSPFRSRQFRLTLIAELAGLAVAVVFMLFVRKYSVVFVIPVALGVYALWWLFHLKSRIFTPRRQWCEANRRAWEFHDAVASAKTVRVHSVEADSVVQVTHDEGTLCLFDIGPGQTYWLDPYCLIPGQPPKDWPNYKFEVMEVPGVKEEVGPFCTGKRLRPRATLEFRDLFEHNTFEPPADGIIHQSLDVFLAEAKSRNQPANR